MKPGERLAEFVAGCRYDDLPQEVVNKGKELIQDSIGCALGAVQTPEGEAYLALAQMLGGPPEASVPGRSGRISSLNAAYVNAQLANLLDFDDTYDLYRPGHPGCHVVQAALALAESTGASGQDLIEAVVAGYESTMRVGKSQGSLLWHNGYGAFACAVGPAAAAASLLRLNAELTKATFDILSAMGALWIGANRGKYDVAPDEVIGTVKGDNGMAAMQGILAALQAKAGLTGITSALDFGAREWYLAGLPEEGYANLTDGLGEEYCILQTSLKPTPSCRWTHVPIGAAWQALAGRTLTPEEVRRIVVKGVNRLQRYEWGSMLEAQFSIPCALALAITGGQPGPAWYTTGRYLDPGILALARKVQYEHDPEAEAREIHTGAMQCEVTIELESGESLRAWTQHIKGAPDDPLTRAEQFAKFRANSSVLGAARTEQALERLMALEQVTDMRPVLKDVYTL